jgi:hypothetical protein
MKINHGRQVTAQPSRLDVRNVAAPGHTFGAGAVKNPADQIRHPEPLVLARHCGDLISWDAVTAGQRPS